MTTPAQALQETWDCHQSGERCSLSPRERAGVRGKDPFEIPDLSDKQPDTTAGLTGHLHLTCSTDASARSYLSHQSFKAPFHISKPYWDGQHLTVQIINPTAGILSGDRLHLDVQVEQGGRLTLTTPSATRVYAMPGGSAAAVQRFSVAAGARLCSVPAMLVPHRNSRFQQTTRIEVERGGELFYIESLAPGRVAHGESFAYTEMRFELELYWDGHLNAREQFRLWPDDLSLSAIRGIFPHAYWVSCYLITNQLAEANPAISSIRELHCADAFVGVSRLPFAGWSIKILAQDSCALHRTLADLRRILKKSLVFGSVARGMFDKASSGTITLGWRSQLARLALPTIEFSGRTP